jgi:hypothetical protein
VSDVVVTVPMGQWQSWKDEGDLPGQPATYQSHFWIRDGHLPSIRAGERIYIVAHGKLRGYAPLVAVEGCCWLDNNRACLLREGGAVAVTLPEPIRGFQGWRYVWWRREDEIPFPDWEKP